MVNFDFAVFHGSVMGTESSFNNKQFSAVLDESPLKNHGESKVIPNAIPSENKALLGRPRKLVNGW